MNLKVFNRNLNCTTSEKTTDCTAYNVSAINLLPHTGVLHQQTDRMGWHILFESCKIFTKIPKKSNNSFFLVTILHSCAATLKLGLPQMKLNEIISSDFIEMHSTCLMTSGNISVQPKGEFSVALKYIIRGDAQSREWVRAESKNAKAIYCKCGSCRQNCFFLLSCRFWAKVLLNTYIDVWDNNAEQQ